MARICIVDDDFDYCEELEYALGRDGHEVITANSGLEAIERGSLFRPDVLVTDWMLKGPVHGLNVSDALLVVCPSMKTILMTGFASGDLQQDAGSSGVIEFIEKPFHLGSIRRAVQNALTLTPIDQESSPIGVFEVDSVGNVVFANSAARRLLDLQSGALTQNTASTELTCRLLAEALHGWIELGARSQQQQLKLIGRTFADVDSKLFIVVASRHQSLQQDERIFLLLGERPPVRLSMPFDGHVLVVDDHSEVRRVSARILRVCSCFCHTAETHHEALRLLERDAAIRYVILDYDMPGANVVEFVAQLRATKPEIRLIGTSALDAREKFAPLGINNYLKKPWNVEDLVRCCVQASS